MLSGRAATARTGEFLSVMNLTLTAIPAQAS
jgi:hypothetical protein